MQLTSGFNSRVFGWLDWPRFCHSMETSCPIHYLGRSIISHQLAIILFVKQERYLWSLEKLHVCICLTYIQINLWEKFPRTRGSRNQCSMQSINLYIPKSWSIVSIYIYVPVKSHHHPHISFQFFPFYLFIFINPFPFLL